MIIIYIRYLLYIVIAATISVAHAGAYEDFFLAVNRDDGDTVRSLEIGRAHV